MNEIKEIEGRDAKTGSDWSPFHELERATQMSRTQRKEIKRQVRGHRAPESPENQCSTACAVAPVSQEFPDNFWPPAEFKVVRLRECPVESPHCDKPDAIAAFWRQHVVTAPWFNSDKECLCVFLLNTRRRLMGYELVSMGTLDTVLSETRAVFRLAFMQNAASIVIAHNHPSGDPMPSEADVKMTRDLIRAGQTLKLDLLDHVVIGQPSRRCPSGYASLRALGYFYN